MISACKLQTVVKDTLRYKISGHHALRKWDIAGMNKEGLARKSVRKSPHDRAAGFEGALGLRRGNIPGMAVVWADELMDSAAIIHG